MAFVLEESQSDTGRFVVEDEPPVDIRRRKPLSARPQKGNDTLYPAGVTQMPTTQDIQNTAAAPRRVQAVPILAAEQVAPDLVTAFEQAPHEDIGTATTGFLQEAPDTRGSLAKAAERLNSRRGPIFKATQQDVMGIATPRQREEAETIAAQAGDTVKETYETIAAPVIAGASRIPGSLGRAGQGIAKALHGVTGGAYPYDEQAAEDNRAAWKGFEEQIAELAHVEAPKQPLNQLIAGGIEGAVKLAPQMVGGTAGMATLSAAESYEEKGDPWQAIVDGAKSAMLMKLMSGTHGMDTAKAVAAVAGISGASTTAEEYQKTGDAKKAIDAGAKAAVQMAVMDVVNRGAFGTGNPVARELETSLLKQGVDADVAQQTAHYFDQAQRTWSKTPEQSPATAESVPEIYDNLKAQGYTDAKIVKLHPALYSEGVRRRQVDPAKEPAESMFTERELFESFQQTQTEIAEAIRQAEKPVKAESAAPAAPPKEIEQPRFIAEEEKGTAPSDPQQGEAPQETEVTRAQEVSDVPENVPKKDAKTEEVQLHGDVQSSRTVSGIGTTNPINEPLRPAVKLPDGKVVAGELTDRHDDLLRDQGAEPGTTGIERGFVDESGQFLTRGEAYKAVEEQAPAVYGELVKAGVSELHSQDLQDATEKAQKVKGDDSGKSEVVAAGDKASAKVVATQGEKPAVQPANANVGVKQLTRSILESLKQKPTATATLRDAHGKDTLARMMNQGLVRPSGGKLEITKRGEKWLDENKLPVNFTSVPESKISQEVARVQAEPEQLPEGIYETRVKAHDGTVSDMYGVRKQEQDAKGSNLGDTLHHTLDEAIAAQKEQAEAHKEKQERLAKQAEKDAVEKAANEKAQAEREDIDGFASDKPAVQLGKIVNTLNKVMRFDGVEKSLKVQIRSLVAEGYTVAESKWGRVLQHPSDGSFYEQKTITKTGLDYAEYLQGKNTVATSPESATVESKGDGHGEGTANSDIRGRAEEPEGTGRKGDEGTLADAESHARAVHGAVRPDPRQDSPAPGQTELVGKQKEEYASIKSREVQALRDYMQEAGEFPSDGFVTAWKQQGKRGETEHKIALAPDKSTVRKFGTAAVNHTWADYFKRLSLHNSIFPDTAYTFRGLSTIDGTLHAVVDQPYYHGDNMVPANSRDVDAEMKALGFEPYVRPQYAGKPTEVTTMARLWVRPHDMVSVWDVRPVNVLQNSDTGTLYFVDPMVEQLPRDYDLSQLTPLKIMDDGTVMGSKVMMTSGGEVVPIESQSETNLTPTDTPTIDHEIQNLSEDDLSAIFDEAAAEVKAETNQQEVQAIEAEQAPPAEETAPVAAEPQPEPTTGKPEKDNAKEPYFKKGDRVQFVNGAHGEVVETSSYVMRSMIIGARGVEGRGEETSHIYNVRKDNGVVVNGHFSEMNKETDAAPEVTPAPVHKGRSIEPDTLLREIENAKKNARSSRNAAERARKREMIDKHNETARKYDQDAAEAQQTFDAWAKQHAEEAAKYLPKEQGGKVEAPKKDISVSGVRVSFNKAHEGIELHFDGKPNTDTIQRVKNMGFRWSGRQKLWYAKETPERRDFANRLAGQEVKKAEEIPLAANEVQPKDSPYVYRKEGEQWQWKVRGGRGDVWNSVNPPMEFRDQLETLLAQKSYEEPAPVAEEPKTIWNDDGTNGPVLITAPPEMPKKPEEKSAADIIGEATKQGVKGAESALKGLHELFGGSSPKSFPGGIDEETYQKAKPHFEEAFSRFREAGKGIKEFFKFLIEQFGDKIKVYAMRFIQEKAKGETLDKGGIIKAGGEEDASLERTAQATDARTSPEGPGAADLPAVEGRGQTASVPEGTGRGDDGELLRSQRGSSVSDTGEQHGLRQDSAGADDGTESGMARRNRDLDGVQRPAAADYRIPQGGLTREGGWRTTAERNLDIVQLVKTLAEESRLATPEEQALLAKYTGWGASDIRNKLFPGYAQNGRLYANWADKEWRPLVDRVEELFTPDELKTAARSSQYAHYTSEGITRSIWNTLERMGFPGGKIFEPGMGTGNFPGTMPDALYAVSKYTGIEFDNLTAAIAKNLYPNQNIIHGDFTKQKFPNDFFDLAIGNPPFSQTKILADPDYKKHGFSLHDYFFAKSIDKVRPGGVLVFVTSRYTMDKLDDKGRAYLADRADLLGAIRLPQTAFKQHSGTEVVTDVIFLRKREAGAEPGGQPWKGHGEVTVVDGNKFMVNEYFAAHPEMVLGNHSSEGSMYGKNEYTVIPIEGADIEKQFAKAAEKLPANIYSVAKRPAKEQKQIVLERDFNPKNKKEGGLYLSDKGKVMRTDFGSGVPLELSADQEKWLKEYIPLRDLMKQARYDQFTEGDWEKSLADLNKAYDAFVKKHGLVNAFTVTERKGKDDEGNEIVTEYRKYKNEKLLATDVEGPLVRALEDVSEDGTITKGPMLLGRTIKKPERGEVKSIGDALAVSLDETGGLNLDHIAELMKLPREEAIEALGDLVYENPDGGKHELADEYLSGDVVSKLAEAEQAARADAKYERNVKALTEVQPKPLTAKDITANLGQTWIPTGHIEEFAEEVLGLNVRISHNPAVNSWRVDFGTTTSGPSYRRRTKKAAGRQSMRSSTSEWGTTDRGANEILDAVLNQSKITIKRVDSDKKTYTDQAATTAINEIADKMKARFRAWIWEDAERAGEVLETYNKRYNNLAPRKFDGAHLTLPGVSLKYSLHPHQKRAIWRVVQTGNTYLAHAVGSGKTIEMIGAGMEMRRLGMIRKPLYVVPNHMLNQFSSEFLDLYPMANIMVADEVNFHTDNRKRFMAQAGVNDPDAIVITHSAFGLLKMQPENIAEVRDELLSELRDALSEAEDDENRLMIRKIEQRIEQAEQRFDSIAGGKGDNVISFEEMGVDFLFVDEAHEFRKLDFTTNQQIKGIDPNGSRKALDLYLKTRYLESKNPGRSHVFASGTPVTNTMGELYTVMRMFMEEDMKREGIGHFDSWSAMFGRTSDDYEPNAAGRYELVTRFAKFDNIPEMMKRVRSFMDVLTSSQLSAYVSRPDIIGGAPKIVVAPPSEALKAYQTNILQPRLEASRKWKPSKDQPGNPDPVINIITDGRLSSIDMRFVDPKAKSDPDSKLNTTIDDIIDTYHTTKDREFANDKTKGATQIVFYNHGFGEQVAARRGFDARAWVNKRLKEGGIPANEIAWIDDYGTAAKREAMFKEMRQGKKKVLIGSAKRMGTGMNVQARLYALHYIDPPWYPADEEQPRGRIIRQGNQHAAMGIPVKVNWYATKGSYDSTMWQMVGRKGRFIEQAFMGDNNVRSLDDISESSQYEMARALSSGDERVIKLVGLQNEVERLSRLQEAHAQNQVTLRYEKGNAEGDIKRLTKRIAEIKEASAKVGGYVYQFTGKIGNREYTKHGEFGDAIKAAYNRTVQSAIDDLPDKESDNNKVVAKPYGSVNGFSLEVHANNTWTGKPLVRNVVVITPRVMYDIDTEQMMYPEATDGTGLAKRVVNRLNSASNDQDRLERSLNEAQDKLKQVGKRLGAPFEYDQELNEKIAEVAQLQAELSAEEKPAEAPAGLEDSEDSPRYSLLRKKAAGIPQTDAQAAIGPLLKKWQNAPQVDVIQAESQLPGDLFDQIRSIGAEGRVRGMFNDGRVYLIADNIKSPEEALSVLLHETVGHFGMRGLLGKDFDPILHQVVAVYGKPGLQEIAKRYGLDLNDQEDRLYAAEEKLAEMSETGEKPGFIKRVIAAIKDWLRKMGVDLKWTDADIKALIAKAQGWVERGKAKATAFDGERFAFVSQDEWIADNLNRTVEPYRDENGYTELEGVIETPVGNAKMGANQLAKLQGKGRVKDMGLILPTLQRPAFVVEAYDPEDGAERDTKYIFIKGFEKPGKDVIFKSVSVSKDSMEVVISNHIDRQGRIENIIKSGKVLYQHETALASSTQDAPQHLQGVGGSPLDNDIVTASAKTVKPKFSLSKDTEAALNAETDPLPQEKQDLFDKYFDLVEAAENGGKAEKKALEDFTKLDAWNQFYEEELPDEPAGDFFGADDEHLTSIKTRVAETERFKENLESVKRDFRTHLEAAESGKAMVDNGELDPLLLARSLNAKPRSMSAEEGMALLYGKQVKENQRRALYPDLKEAREKQDKEAVNKIEAQLLILDDDIGAMNEAAIKSGYEQSLAFSIRRLFIKDNYTFENVVADLESYLPAGQYLTADLKQQVKDLTIKLQEAETNLAKAEERASKREVTKVVTRYRTESDQARQRRRQGRKADRTEIETEFKGLSNQLKAMMGRLHFNFDPEMAVILGKMAKLRIEEGITKAEDIIDSIYEEFAEYEDVSKRDIRDAISGYGKTLEMSKDEIDVELREARRVMRLVSALEDAGTGHAPLRSGMQRDPVSDDVRHLQQQVKEEMKRHGIVIDRFKSPEQQWKSALDAVKTRLHNQITDLTKQLETGEKTPKRAGIEYDAEAKALQAERDRLRKAIQDIEGKPEMSPEQRIRIATQAVEKSIAEYERRIEEHDLSPRQKGSNTPDTQGLTALKERRDALRKVYQQMQKDAKPKMSPEERALKMFKKRMEKKEADLQARLDSGQYEPVPKQRRTIIMDPEAMNAQERVKRLQGQLDQLRFEQRMANRTNHEKRLHNFLLFRRAVILSGTPTLLKLATAAMLRQVMTPIEEGIGAGLRRIPGIKNIAAEAPREGAGFDLTAEVAALRQWFEKQTRADILNVFTTGMSQLDAIYSDRQHMPPEAIEVFGRLHGSLKVTPKRAEFYRSIEKRAKWLKQQNPAADLEDPAVKAAIGAAAYVDANRAIFMNDNVLTGCYKAGIRYLKQHDVKHGGNAGKNMAAFMQAVMPIIKVPTNFALETGLYAGGVFAAGPKMFKRYKGGKESITQEEADFIMRSLKKQVAGIVVMVLGYALYESFGGFYQRFEKRKQKDVHAHGARIGDMDIPKAMLHTPILEMFQIGATIHRKQEQFRKMGKSEGAGAFNGLLLSMAGVAQQIPFIDTPARTVEQLRTGEGWERVGGEFLKSLILPPDLQANAKAPMLSVTMPITTALGYAFRNEGEENLSRKPENIVDQLKMGVPGLRQQVPVNYKKEREKKASFFLEDLRDGKPLDEVKRAMADAVRRGEISDQQRQRILRDAKESELGVSLQHRNLEGLVKAAENIEGEDRAKAIMYAKRKAEKKELPELAQILQDAPRDVQKSLAPVFSRKLQRAYGTMGAEEKQRYMDLYRSIK